MDGFGSVGVDGFGSVGVYECGSGWSGWVYECMGGGVEGLESRIIAHRSKVIDEGPLVFVICKLTFNFYNFQFAFYIIQIIK